MSSTLWSQTNYDKRIDYVFESSIVEYDIQKANISVLHSIGKISDEVYHNLLNADRMNRQVYVGNLIARDNSIYSSLSEGISRAKRVLFDTLSVEDVDVLHIVNDAVFLIRPIYKSNPQEIVVNNDVRFTLRGKYRSYYNLVPTRNIHMYATSANSEFEPKIRGIGESIELHRRYFFDILCKITSTEIDKGVRTAYGLAKRYFRDMANHKLGGEYYRRFDSQSMFDMTVSCPFSGYMAKYLFKDTEPYVDPWYNMSIIDHICNMYASYLLNKL